MGPVARASRVLNGRLTKSGYEPAIPSPVIDKEKNGFLAAQPSFRNARTIRQETRRIGLPSAALAFAREGAGVVATDMSEQDNQETARLVEERKAGGRSPPDAT